MEDLTTNITTDYWEFSNISTEMLNSSLDITTTPNISTLSNNTRDDLTPLGTLSYILQANYCVFGLVGNVLSLIIFAKKEMKSFYTFFLLALIACDSLALVNGFLAALTGLKVENLLDLNIHPVVRIYWNACDLGIKYFTVLIAAERFYVVNFPLRAFALQQEQETKSLIVTIGVGLIAIGLAVARHYCYVHFKPGYQIFSAIIVNFLPFVVVVFFSVGMYLGLRKINKSRKRLNRSERKEVSATKMLLTVTGVFGICCVFEIIRRILVFAGYKDCKDVFDHVSTHFFLINASIDFIIYGVMSEQFRKQFFKTFRCLRIVASSRFSGGGSTSTERERRSMSHTLSPDVVVVTPSTLKPSPSQKAFHF